MVDFDNVVSRRGTYSTQWDYVKDRFGEADLLPFTISDMDFKSPAGVSEVIKTVANRGIFGYTRWNNPEFKEAIRNWYRSQYDTDVDSDAIVYSPSVIFSLAKLVEQFSKENGLVLTLTPCYDAFISTITSNSRRLFQYRIDKGVDFEKLEQTFVNEKPEIFLLCNPHNPLGIVWTENDMQKFVDLCNAYHVSIISDEIHLDILREGVKGNSLAKFFKELTVPAAVITSASKSFNTPALGCSYALIPDERERLDFLYTLKAKNALSSVPYLGMLSTIECYNHQENWLQELCSYIDGNFVYVSKFLKKRLDIEYKIPDATYLAWIDISDLNVEMKDLQLELVTKQKVAIMDGRIYGNGGKNHLRLNLGAPRKKVADGLERLAKAVESLRDKKNSNS
ncbi:MalY/PatB family protein [Bavariicoccus seileri]|uniref:MalY/PatB family protein n=1 Tax=Bavariicoccus seileri TaxID=549685 RepID=UPI0003B33C44|nr:aminotransferase class I/II-fold pyridoxal phosphate-dependent enzyme [Bavariicoccus seileri]